MTVSKTGQCMCGAVTFTVQDPEAEIGACHCEMCRRWTGSALMALSVPLDKILVSGDDNIARFQSSEWAERAFCKTCGSGLWYRVTADGPFNHTYQVPVGLLDDANGITLTREIFVDQKPETFSYAGPTTKMTRAEVMERFAVSFDDIANPEQGGAP